MIFPTAFRCRHILLLSALIAVGPVRANEVSTAPNEPAEPKLLTGTIYQKDSERKKVLFLFQRTATLTGETLRVERRFLQPDGTLVAVENITYQAGQLVDYQMSEPRANIFGDIRTIPDPKKPGARRILIDYCPSPADRNKIASEPLQPDTLIADNLYPFIIAHWQELMRGESMKFRFISLEQECTYTFQLAKESESSLNERPSVRLKMTPTNPLVSMMVDPLYFTLEKDGDRRLLNYVGRTTPRIKKGKMWKYLDAETVFDWK